MPEARAAMGTPAALPGLRHVGCCDQSIGKHATKHFQATQHPVMEDYYPGEGWGWCYVDEVMIDLGGDVTAHPPGWKW